MKIKDCKQSQKHLISFVTQCFLSLKTYGKAEEALEASINMHLLCLEDYSYNVVKWAFLEHIKTSNEAPTPADIIKIIESQFIEQTRNQRIFTNLTRKSQLMDLTDDEKIMLENAKSKIDKGNAA